MMYPNMMMCNFTNQFNNNNFCFPNNTNQMRNMLNNIGMPMANNFFCGAQLQGQLNNMNFNNFAQNNVTNQQNIDPPKVEVPKLPEDRFRLEILIKFLNQIDTSLGIDKDKLKNYVKQIMVNLNDKIKILLENNNRDDEQNKELDLLRFKMYKYSVINNFYFPSKYSYMLFDGTSGYFPFSGKNHNEGEFRYWNPDISDFITFSKEDIEELEDIKTNSNGKIIKHAERIKNLKDDLDKAKQENNKYKIKEIEHGFDNCFPRTGNNNIGATCFFDSANMFMLMENPVFFKYLVEFGNKIFKRDEKLNQNGFNSYVWGGEATSQHFINPKYIDNQYMFHKFKDKDTEKLIKSKYKDWSSNKEHQAFHVLVALADYATALVDAQKEDIAVISPLYLANLMVSICNNRDVFEFLNGTNGVPSFMAFDENGNPKGGDVLNCFKVLFDVMSPTKFAPKFSVNQENIPALNNYDLSSSAMWQTESRLTLSFLTNSMIIHNCTEDKCVNGHKQDKVGSEHITYIDASAVPGNLHLKQSNDIRFTEILRAAPLVQFKGIGCTQCGRIVEGLRICQYNMFGGSNSVINFFVSEVGQPNKFKFPKLIKAGDGNYWAQISRTSLWGGNHWKAITVPYEELLLFDDFEYREDTKKSFGVAKEIDLSEASKLDGLKCNLKAWYGYRKISEKNYNLLKAQYQQECQRTGLSTEDHIVDLSGTPFEVASENNLLMNSPLYNFYMTESNKKTAVTDFLQDLASDIKDPELNKIKVNDNEQSKNENIVNDENNTEMINKENDNNIENEEEKSNNEKVLISENNNNNGNNNDTANESLELNKMEYSADIDKNIEEINGTKNENTGLNVDQTKNKNASGMDNPKNGIINEEKKKNEDSTNNNNDVNEDLKLNQIELSDHDQNKNENEIENHVNEDLNSEQKNNNATTVNGNADIKKNMEQAKHNIITEENKKDENNKGDNNGANEGLESNKMEYEHNKTVTDNTDINTDINKNVDEINSNTNEKTQLNVDQTENKNNLETNNSEENIAANSANGNENDANHVKSIEQDGAEGNNQLESDNKENNETRMISDNDKVEKIDKHDDIDDDEQEKEKNDESPENPKEGIIAMNNNIVKKTEENNQNNDILKKLLMIIGVVLLVAAVTLFALQFKIWICVSVLITGGFTGGIGYNLDKITICLKRFFGVRLSYAQKNTDYNAQKSIRDKIDEINNNVQSNDTQNKTNNLGKDDNNSKNVIENEQ